MVRHRLDQTLRYLYQEMLKEQRAMPKDKRMGFQAWCHQNGILAPEDWAAIRRNEILVSDLDGGGSLEEDYD